MAESVRTLTIDIETSPAVVVTFDLFNVTISPDHVLKPSEVTCFAAKWKGDRKVQFFSSFHDGKKTMVKAAHSLLSEADIVVHYNGTSFDVPHLQREFAQAKLGPPAPFKQVDLFLTVKRQFRFLSNKLGYVGPQLGIGEKIKHEGMALWLACMDSDAAAWKRMEKYNRQDVVLTEQMYDYLLPWIPSHPNLATMAGRPDTCPKCGSDKGMVLRKHRATQVGIRDVFQCKGCRGYSASRKIQRTETEYVA